MKKALAFTLALMLLMLTLGTTALAATTYKEDYYTWSYEKGTVWFHGNVTDIHIRDNPGSKAHEGKILATVTKDNLQVSYDKVATLRGCTWYHLVDIPFALKNGKHEGWVWGPLVFKK